jgi:hypothetical protein
MKKTKIIIVLALALIAGALNAQSPLFYAYGNISNITDNGIYKNVTINNFSGGYRQYPDPNYEESDIPASPTDYVFWTNCTRFSVVERVSSTPLVLKVIDINGALESGDLANARLCIVQESRVGSINIGAVPNVADGNAGAQIGISPFEFACMQNYYKVQTATIINSTIGVGSTAGGDLNGTYPNPTVDGIQGRTVSSSAPSTGQTYVWNGTSWAPSNITVSTSGVIEGDGTSGTPVKLAPGTAPGDVLNWDGAVWRIRNLSTESPIEGTGLLTDPFKLADGTAPGDVIYWNGSEWVASQYAVTTEPSLSGDGTSAFPLELFGASSATTGQIPRSDGAGSIDWQSLATHTTISGNGTSGSPLAIAQQGATSGQVLKWNGTDWAPGTDNSGAGTDETWGKGSYSSPTYSGKTITDAVFRRGPVSIFTADTLGRLNVYHNDTLNNNPVINVSGDGELFLKVKKDSRSATGTDINFVRKYGPSGDGLFNNQIVSFGINNTSGGGAENSSYPSIRYAIEENFRNGAGNYNAFECHLPDIYYPPPFNIGRRPISGYYTRNGADLKGHTGFVSDYFVFHDYKDNALKATWAFRTPSPYALGIRFADSSGIYLGKNNYGGFFQRNAANNADVRIAYVNDANEVILGGQNETSVVAYNALKVSNTGQIWNENNDLLIGGADRPTRLTVHTNDGIGFSIKRTGHAYTATHGLFNQQYYITNPGTGTTPWRINMDAPEYSFWIRSSGRTGFGEANPAARIHATETGGATSPMLAFSNTTGTSIFYRTSADPESVITASQGDWAMSNTGEWFGKVSGTNTNTGWGKFLNLKDNNGASSGQVLSWNGSTWAPSAVSTLPSGTDGQTLRHNGTSWVATSSLVNTGGGFIGINNATPSQRLHVVGNARASKFMTDETGSHTALESYISGTKSWQMDNVGGDMWFYPTGAAAYTFAIKNSNGFVGIGNTSPSDNLHVTGSARITEALKDSNNEAGTSGQFLSTTGTATDWVTVNQESTSIGTYQTTGTANGLSQSGTAIQLHSVTATTPGAVDLNDLQVLGDGSKIIQSNVNGETTPLILRNSAAAGADAGPGILFQGGASNASLLQIQANLVGATSANGSLVYFNNRLKTNSMNSFLTAGSERVATMNGYWRKETKDLTANYDASASLSNRYGHYCATVAGVALTLPLTTDMGDGVEVTVSNLTSSGADVTVNTAAGYSEFMYDYDLDAGTGGNQFFAASLSVPAGKSFTLTRVTISSVSYWKITANGSATDAQTLSNSSSSTSHTVSLSGTATSFQLNEGSGISLTTSGTVAAGIVTIDATDAAADNEGILGVGAGGPASSVILTNTTGGNGININVAGSTTINESASSNGGTITITGAIWRAESFTATASQTSFTASASFSAPSGNSMPFTVERNGVVLQYVASAPNFRQFSYSGSTITTSACDANDIVIVKYQN